MRQVHPHPLWIGNRGDLRQPRAITAAGISFLIDLAIDEPIPSLSRELAFARFPLEDGVGNEPWLLRMAIDACALALRQQQTVMVMCSAGMSRSPAIAAAALSLHTGQPAPSCLALVTAGGGDVSPGLWGKILHVLSNSPDHP